VTAADSSNRIADKPSPSGRAAPSAREPVEPAPAHRLRDRSVHFLRSLAKTLATLAVFAVAVLAALVIWNSYITAPWTRDGRIRVQVASVAPQVSGQITELRVGDNQYVHKGDVLYVIDPFDFQVKLDEAKQQLAMKAADLEVKKVESERRKKLSDLATTPEEQQQYAGSAVQAQAAFGSAQSEFAQAEINLQRTQVTSPVNGFVTNLLMRVGDYAHAGASNISVIDSDSYWIDGYFEETKLAHVCVGDRAEAQLMGYAQPILGRVDTVTRGISVSDAAPSTQGLPSVDPIYTWVRLAQRVPVRIVITDVPPGVPLVSGLTATVTIRDAEARQDQDGFERRWRALADRIGEVFHRPQPQPSCVPAIGKTSGVISTLPTPIAPPTESAIQVVPGLAPGLDTSPRK
jgi:multidrug resistance efflux pump